MGSQQQVHAASVDDTRTPREKSIDDWLPVTASRKAKWWYSAFHNVTAMIGAGVLGLPFAMSELKWGPGVAVLVFSWVVTLFTLWQMVEMHEIVPGKRFNRYHELGQHAFGERLGLWIVVPQQLVVQVGLDIVYMVTGGKSLKKFHKTVCPNCNHISVSGFITIFASVHFVLCQLPSLNAVSAASLAAAVMSVSYSTVAWAASLRQNRPEAVDYGYRADNMTGTVFSFFSALGAVAFAYAGHSVVLEIQATIPSTPEKPSKGPMWKGAVTAYIIVALCYFPVAITGYWVFGNAVDENILVSLEKPRWVIAMANMMVAVHVVGSYQVFAMLAFDTIEAFLTKKIGLPPKFTLRLVSRSIYVAFTMFMAIAFPFFGELLGFFGGFALAPTSYFYHSGTLLFWGAKVIQSAIARQSEQVNQVEDSVEPDVLLVNEYIAMFLFPTPPTLAPRGRSSAPICIALMQKKHHDEVVQSDAGGEDRQGQMGDLKDFFEEVVGTQLEFLLVLDVMLQQETSCSCHQLNVVVPPWTRFIANNLFPCCQIRSQGHGGDCDPYGSY